jgi:hypothetical protein
MLYCDGQEMAIIIIIIITFIFPQTDSIASLYIYKELLCMDEKIRYLLAVNIQFRKLRLRLD